MNSRVIIGLLLLPWFGLGCGDAPTDAGWRFRFAELSLATRAELVETEIRQGGCDGATVFSTRVSPTSAGASAPELAAGRYGFRGRARDAECQWFAEGCAEAELPRKDAIEIVLDRSMFPFLDQSCVPGEQSGEPATEAEGGIDDGEGEGSTGSGEGGSSGVPADAGTAAPDAAQPAPFDPSAPKCASADLSVIACFDFARTLSDGSNAGNDAISSLPPVFETALSGQAVRVGGDRLALADDASLNPGSFSVEVWLRPDSLVNLDNQLNDISLLVDKDQQYNVGFTAQGALRMQVYRAIDNSESTTASDTLLSTGQFVYVAFTYDGARSNLYKDGQRVDSELIGLDLFRGNGGSLHIGSGSPDSTRPFDGLIDALRISNVARSDADICASAGKSLTGVTCK